MAALSEITESQKTMLRIYLIAIIALLAGLLVLALLIRLGRRHAEGSVLIVWRHLISAAVGVIVFLGAALLLEFGGTGQPGADYQPPRIEGGKIKPGHFNKSQFGTDAWPGAPLTAKQASGQVA